jgi:predicted phosphodiesterase
MGGTTNPRTKRQQPPGTSLQISRLTLLLLLATTTSTSAWPVHPRTCGGLPKHVHLAVGADPSSMMTVSFASIPSKFDHAPMGGVLVGISPAQLDRVVLEQEKASSYTVKVRAGGRQANHPDGLYYSSYYHHVTITGLEPATTYFYKPVVHARVEDFGLRGSSKNNATTYDTDYNEAVENLEAQDHSEAEVSDGLHRQLNVIQPYDGSSKQCPSSDKIRSFRTAPRGPDTAVNIALMGDIGQFAHSEETLARMIRARDTIDTVILAGDLAYSGTDHRQWDTFFDFLDDYPIAEHCGMQVVPGNHDIDKQDEGDEIFMAYEHRFRMPRVKPAELGRYDGPLGAMNMDQPPYPLPYEWGNAFYAYTYGPARMIMISSYAAMEPESKQHQWIEQELRSVDREVTPWLLVVLHTPLYNTFSLHQKDPQIAAAKEHLEPLFVKYGVNMVFSGHIHAYLRTEMVAHDELHPAGPIHITIGAGGRKCEAPFRSEVPEPWVAVRDATIYGYGMFRIQNRTHAEWDWIHTGYNEERNYNEIKYSNTTLPSVSNDRVMIANQFYAQV